MGETGVEVGVGDGTWVTVAVGLGEAVRVGWLVGETIPQADNSKPRQTTEMA